MLPVILITSDRKYIDAFVTDQAKEHKLAQVMSFGDEEGLSIEIIREIAIESTKPSLSTKIFVLHNFDSLKQEGQNAFLKTLEEQSENSVFILTSKDEFAVLPTIASRCKIIRVASKQSDDDSLIVALDLFNQHPLAHYLGLSQTLSKEKQIKAITQIRTYVYLISHSALHQDNAQKYSAYSVLEKIMEIEHQLKNNIYPEFALDYILIALHKASLLPLPAQS